MECLVEEKEQLISELFELRKEVNELCAFKEEHKRNAELQDIFTAIVENLSEGIVIVDIDSRILYVNKAIERLMGYSSHELIGKDAGVLNGEKEAESIQIEIVACISRGERWCREIHEKRKDGSTYLAELEIFPIFINEQPIARVSIQRDITKRKLLEEALWESKKRYETLLKVLPVGVFQSNADGSCFYTNEQTSKILGLSNEEMTDLKWFASVHPDDKKRVISELIRCTKNHEIFKMEYRFLHPDKKIVWVIGEAVPYMGRDNKPLYYVGTITDITERKQMEASLRESERFLSNIFESIQDRLSVIDTEFNIIRVNPTVEKVYSQTQALIGNKCYKVFHGQEQVCQGCPSIITLKRSVTAHAVVPSTDPYGNTIGWLDHFCHPFLDMATGQLKGVIIYARDITEKIKAEQEMARLERLNLIGEMAASIGHEIRNPMTAVRGLLQMLASKEDCNKYQGHFKIMIDELDRANSIITEFLSLAKNKSVDLKAIKLNTILRALLPLITANAINVNVDVIFKLEEIPDLVLNENEMYQLILNLVKNGLEAMERGGKLTISTFRDNGEEVLTVQDQGSGINPDLLDKIGTPFFTTKEQGTGLGLAVCYGIAARHNANIKFETGPTGTTFFVRFKIPQN